MTSAKPTLDQRIEAATENATATDYSSRSGVMLVLLSQLARDGDLTGMSKAYRAFREILPVDAHLVAADVPDMILNQYFFLWRECPKKALMAWINERAGWKESLAAAIGDDAGFQNLVESMLVEAKRFDC